MLDLRLPLECDCTLITLLYFDFDCFSHHTLYIADTLYYDFDLFPARKKVYDVGALDT